VSTGKLLRAFARQHHMGRFSITSRATEMGLLYAQKNHGSRVAKLIHDAGIERDLAIPVRQAAIAEL